MVSFSRATRSDLVLLGYDGQLTRSRRELRNQKRQLGSNFNEVLRARDRILNRNKGYSESIARSIAKRNENTELQKLINDNRKILKGIFTNTIKTKEQLRRLVKHLTKHKRVL